MDTIYDIFYTYLSKEDKESCVKYALDLLEKKTVNIVELYTKILEPSLNNIGCEVGKENLCIWKEHVRSSIIRTIIECSFPYVLKERDLNNTLKKNLTAIVICPDGEYHEIGARIIADFFTLCGYNTIFVGGSTPKNEFLSVVNTIRPHYVAISVTNYYNLVSAKKTIELLREKVNTDVKIVVGGQAFLNKKNILKDIDANYLIQTFDDIKKLSEEDSL
ncbi:UNVERIFIED_CONTAM: methanogenic corrinoid protein MtbC1 [Acetivibrio alkalicellulosi]